MCMVTKTITITKDAYNLLAQHKQQSESFSEEIRRIFSKKKTKTIADFFGILTHEQGEAMLDDLEKRRTLNIQLQKERQI